MSHLRCLYRCCVSPMVTEWILMYMHGCWPLWFRTHQPSSKLDTKTSQMISHCLNTGTLKGTVVHCACYIRHFEWNVRLLLSQICHTMTLVMPPHANQKLLQQLIVDRCSASWRPFLFCWIIHMPHTIRVSWQSATDDILRVGRDCDNSRWWSMPTHHRPYSVWSAFKRSELCMCSNIECPKNTCL